MDTFVVLKQFNSAAKAEEFCFLFEMMGVDAKTKKGDLLVAEKHLKKARELAEDYFKNEA